MRLGFSLFSVDCVGVRLASDGKVIDTGRTSEYS